MKGDFIRHSLKIEKIKYYFLTHTNEKTIPAYSLVQLFDILNFRLLHVNQIQAPLSCIVFFKVALHDTDREKVSKKSF